MLEMSVGMEIMEIARRLTPAGLMLAGTHVGNDFCRVGGLCADRI